MITPEELLTKAEEAMAKAYAPYSNFKVGAALLCKDGTVFTGCNVENSAYGVCNCAERTALFKAVSEGYTEFLSIAIVGGKEGIIEDFCYPCGVCRQALSEFVDQTFKFYFKNKEGMISSYTFEEILPHSFDLL
ncbi:MAG: cytidine deaminase [Oscillospiraceae bacterium]|nr:cytidine deaminase [Candidatus Limimonas coprohippi]MCQ2487981.1 cytidine deaminase [Clostridia bacterium]